MYKQYMEKINSGVSKESLAKKILNRVEKEWDITEIISASRTDIYTFEEAHELCYFIDDNQYIYFCGPINLRREKTAPATTLWTFDFLYFMEHTFKIIKDVTYQWDALPNCKFPEKMIVNPYLLAKYGSDVIILESNTIYSADKMKEVFLVNMYWAGEFLERTFNLSFFANNQCIKKCESVLDVEPSPSKAGTVYYRNKGDSKYTEYNIVVNKEIAKRTYAESYYIRKELDDFRNLIYMGNDGRHLAYKMTDNDKILFDKRVQMYHSDYQEYYFSVKDPITEILINSHFSKVANVEQVKNDYEDDFSRNYRIQINKENKDTIYLWKYICRERLIKEPALYGVEICQLFMYLKGNRFFVVDEKAVENVLNILRQKSNIDILTIIRGWMLKFPYKSLLSTHGDYFKYRDGEEQKEYYYVCEHLKQMRNYYNNILQQLIEQGKISPRWKSEFSLFLLAKSYYPSTEYQYRAGWLGNQSLDIYIPDFRIGIEYQGLQHYEPVEIFGGTESLEDNQKRDAEKRIKCKNNGVLLLEWSYQTPIDDKIFQKLMRDSNVPIPQKKNTDFNFLRDIGVNNNEIKTYICQYDMSGIFLNKYDTVRDAEACTGVQGYNIQRAYSGFRKTAGGYQWKKVKEGEFGNISKVSENAVPTGPRAVARYDLNGNFIERYESIAAAVKDTQVNSKSIRDAANGKQHKAGGFKWKFIDE